MKQGSSEPRNVKCLSIVTFKLFLIIIEVEKNEVFVINPEDAQMKIESISSEFLHYFSFINLLLMILKMCLK